MCEKRRKSHTWEPAGADMLPEPENCPNAIFEFYNRSKADNVRSVDLKLNVKKHILSLNWSIEYKSQENCSNKYRYISPDGSKTYYSLNTLCADLVKSAEPGTCSPPIEQAQKLTLIPQENQTLNLSSPIFETLPFTSLLTEFEDFMELPIETLAPTPKEGQTRNLLSFTLLEQSPVESFSSLLVEPRIYEYFKKSPMGPDYSVPQEDSPMKTLPQITQDGDLAMVPSGPLIKKKSKSIKAPCNTADIEPGHWPEAIAEYYNLGSIATRSQKDDERLKDLRMKVKKHMCYVGWEIFYINKGNRQELRYLSPSGRRYISLITACKAYLDENGKYDQIPYTQNASNASQKRLTPFQDYSYPISDYSHVSKRARPPSPPPPAAVVEVGLPSSRPNSRNLLARLIDSNEVCVGTEVHYRAKDGRSMREGHISTDGMIKCNCCQELFNLSNFEAHAGSSNHRPAANIFLKDGRSLQEIQLLLKPEEQQSQLFLKSDNNKVKTNQKHKKVKGNRDQISKGYKCSICNKWGALVLCYQCPSKFHTTCLGLHEVPNGDWFCKACVDEPTNEAESCPQAIIDYVLIGNISTRMDDNNEKLMDMRSKAKKHLCSIGWSFFHANWGNKRELQYKSPSGRVYVSLLAACEGCIFEGGLSLM